jgi:predicted Zn finger-like uncharacterized protein
MSLATRCSACGTIFRVVQDQLKASEGWVRCGRCDEVFSAIEGLFDLERDAPPNWVPPPAPPAPPAAVVSAKFITPSAPPPDDDDVLQLDDEDRIHSRFFQPEQDDVDKTPSEALSHRDRVDFADARFNDELISETDPNISPPSIPPALAKRRISKKSKKTAPPPPPPGFIQAAQRKELWHSLPMRFTLATSSLVLVASLLAQTAFHFRDSVAARWPGTRPLLEQACEWKHCRLGLPRAIDDITLESSALSPINGQAQTYRLSVVLRNRHKITLAMPYLDLTLSDAQGQIISRRSLAPAEFGANTDGLQPGLDISFQVLLSTQARPVSGYTVEIFYP